MQELCVHVGTHTYKGKCKNDLLGLSGRIIGELLNFLFYYYDLKKLEKENYCGLQRCVHCLVAGPVW